MIGGIGTGGLVIVCEVDSEYVHYRFVDDDLDGHNNFTRNIYEFVNNFKEVKYGSN
jgi:hypothetical protein